jgi:uncharacterized protein DUF1549/uncharacterized protein DUF1553/cytochrome c/concanavalin A-like lectin/glucanase superfamily protein
MMFIRTDYVARWLRCCRAITVILCLTTWSLRACAATAAPTAEALEFFEQRIRPVLVAECYECHGAEKQKGGLRVDFRDGLLKGGDTGAAVVPGNPAKSLLLTAIKHLDPDMKMPDKAPKLEDAMIADFEKWIAMGAPDPRDEPPQKTAGKPTWEQTLAVRKLWWSLRPVTKPEPPAVKGTAWSQHPVDRFLLAKMEEHGLAPAPDADPRTFIRRLTFALTGLPPTPEEVEAFVAESIRNPQSAIRDATDRLLASPRFGERWARHWMDLVRYADTHGSEGDPPILEAWRYRDYLIRALNADVPCDQLIREHLAGDLLAHPRMNPAGFNESILGIAQLRLVEHGFQPVDTLDDQVKAVDNQIDVVCKSFQALTVSCARCHDHKFDAISQRDYYALFGVFASSRPAQVTIDAPEVLAKNRAALEQVHGRIKAALADAWLAAAAKIGERLLAEPERAAQAEAVAARVRELEQKIAEIDWKARSTALRSTAVPAVRTAGVSPAGPATSAGETPAGRTGKMPVLQPSAPIALWNFEHDARDAIGALHGHLEGGAEVKNGRLVLNGKAAFVRTDPLTRELREKTLEAWVAPASLDQRGGGVMTVESTNVHGFDSIVFAEKDPRRWLAGSEFFKRSRAVGGPEETAKPGELVHLAIVYRADNSIALYRNGEPYGSAYAQGELKTFESGNARVLFGLRHAGAKGFFAGEIEEARLYDRALSAGEIAASFRAGTPQFVSPEQIATALTPQQREERAALTKEIEQLRARLADEKEAGDSWRDALRDAADNAANPLHAWVRLVSRRGDTPVAEPARNGESSATRVSRLRASAFADAWKNLAQEQREQLDAARSFNRESFRPAWDLTAGDYSKWFRYGTGLPAQPYHAGEFAIEPDGDRVLGGIFPAGALTHRLSDKHNGLLASPRFKIETDSISVRAFGGGGAMVRVIVDNYPLPVNPIFPKAVLEKDEPGWVRLDTAYRKGSWAYIEFATHDDLTRPVEPKAKTGKAGEKTARPDDGRSHFGVEKVVFHDGKEPPREENLALLAVPDADANAQAGVAASRPAPQGVTDLAALYQRVLIDAIDAWRNDRLAAPQRALLDFFVRHGLLPVTLAELENLRPLVADYRRLEAEVPVPQRAPGVLEADSYDAPFLPRGDHTKPGEPVPRGYLGVFGRSAFFAGAAGSNGVMEYWSNGKEARGFGIPSLQHSTTPLLHHSPAAPTGRLQLADAIADPRNPLTARVMVNRIWHWLFGRGIVPTVDNFGRLGEKPTHPELLDYLAARFMEPGSGPSDLRRSTINPQLPSYPQPSDPQPSALNPQPSARAWSIKEMIRFLVTTRAFAMSSDPTPQARDTDPANEWLSHMRVRRLEAEELRDSLLAVSGRLDGTMFGPGVDGNAPRRSVYLAVRRTNLNPFLAVFDAPKPFSTLGRRDATNVPAQSLTLLNSPFVIDLAHKWSQSLASARDDSPEARVRRMFVQAFARDPATTELTASLAFLNDLAREQNVPAGELLTHERIWQDFAQSLFNLKEFIYLR